MNVTDQHGAIKSNASDRRSFHVVLLVIVCLAALFRFGYVIVAKAGDPAVGDQIYYSAQASTLADGRLFDDPFMIGIPAADHAPLTSVALVPASVVGQHTLMQQRLLMAAYGSLVVAAIGLLGYRVGGRRTGLVAAGIAAVYANLWMNDGLAMSETLATLAAVCALLATIRLREHPDLRSAAILGAVLGIATLTRAELLLLYPILTVLAILRSSTSVRNSLRLAAVAGCAMVLMVGPWVGWNLARFEQPTFISTQDGLTLAGANCQQTYFGPGVGFWSYDCATVIEPLPGRDKSTVSGQLRSTGIDYALAHTAQWPTVVAARLGAGLSVWRVSGMIYLNTGEGREAWASRLGVYQWWILVPFAIFGLVNAGRFHRWLLLSPMILSVLVIAAFYGIPRFRVCAEGAVVVAAALGIDHLIRRFRSSSEDASASASMSKPAPHPVR